MVWTAEESRFGSRQELRILLFSMTSRPASELTRPPVQWMLGAVSPGVKGQGPEADY
jgi:hypothetical protein